ncbi:hypothetical protein EGT29_09915 [Pigmentiphaga sp. H8]|uniref:TadG family pilus assembly protein n=1 Tax=Pigmentiphaga sp. H8 TaxID=2488560 RepID=UPI000F5A1F42|nr:TadG family pilus assembly protein [Pigmentiphaga sp. H8]AZG08174.1 hypothetical protein EGT29_09915 [Pigmentiphaga sp. H8]
MTPHRRIPSFVSASRAPLARQRGSVLIAAAAAMLVSVTLLASADLGYLFYMKRELQKTADLAALAGAQQLERDSCVAATAAARGNANLNLQRFALSMETSPAPVCGRWDPNPDSTRNTVQTMEPPSESYSGTGGKKYFGTPKSTAGFNAIKVAISQQVPLVLPFLGNRSLYAEAIAVQEAPVASFWVGSKLATSNSQTAPLCVLLRVVGANLCEDLGIGTYAGLAGVKITPSGLLKELGIPVGADLSVGQLNDLLAARKVELGQLLNAIVSLANQNSLLGLNASLLNSLTAKLGIDTLLVQLGSNSVTSGLFALIQAPSAGSALNVDLDALGLLTAAVGVGVSNHAVTVDLGLPAAVSTAVGLKANVRASIIEPPSVGIGGLGTRAYTAQVRTFVDIATDGGLVGGLLGLLGTQVKLPIVLDVVSSQGTLTGMSCTAPAKATIKVDSSIAKLCMGKVNESTLWSTHDVCATGLQDETFVKLLGINLLHGQVKPDILAQDPVYTTLEVDQTKTVGRNELPLGDTVQDLVNQLLALLLAQSSSGQGAQLEAFPADTATQVADKYLNQYGYTPSVIEQKLLGDGITWPRPCGLLGLGTCAMPTLWRQTVTPLLGTCNQACMRTELIKALQTTASNGVLGGLLNAVGDLLGSLLGGTGSGQSQNLLQAILSPLVGLLKPLLNEVGLLLANLLDGLVGIKIGQTDVHLMSLECDNVRLVY